MVMTTFEPTLLPDREKEELCRSLLCEFGLNPIRITDKGEMTISCPVGEHSDQQRNPTASLNYKKLVFKCLGCKASGGLLWFIATMRHGSATDARRWLAKEVGADGETMDLSKLLQYFDAIYDDKRQAKPIPHYSTRVLDPWMLIHPYLTDPIEEGGRGIPEETVNKYRLGYAEDYVVGKDYTSERIILPHFWKGDLVGWQTRRLDATDGTPKYLNSPDFPKDQTLFNYNPRLGKLVVVESMMSVLRHVHEIPEMTATFGASVTDQQINLLTKADTVVLFMDSDAAGWDAVEQRYDKKSRSMIGVGMAERLARHTNVFVVDNPYAADPADFETEIVKDLVKNAIPYSVWSRPEVLLCYACKNQVHRGECEVN